MEPAGCCLRGPQTEPLPTAPCHSIVGLLTAKAFLFMPLAAESGYFVLEDFGPLNTVLFIKDGALETLRDTLLSRLMSGEVRVALGT